MCGVEDHLQDMWYLVKEENMPHKLCQKPNITNGMNRMQFEAYVKFLESYGGCVPIHPALLMGKLKKILVTDVHKPGKTENTNTKTKVKVK